MFEEKTIEETVQILETDACFGLTEVEAKRRLERDGKNQLKEKKTKGVIERFLEQLNDPLICVLLVAAFLSFLLKEISDAMIIILIVVVNGIVGVIQEGKARKALESLKKLTSPEAYVKRNGKRKKIPASDLVRGDIVFLEAGMQVPADMRLTQSFELQAEEASLTGESFPVEKDSQFLSKRSLPIGDRKNQVFLSTLITRGRGEGIVTQIGMGTELGKIAAMLDEVKTEYTPLQKRLEEIGIMLSVGSVVLCIVLFVIAVWQKRNILDMFLTAVSLAVAAVPEGLPAIVTVVLAMSVQKMVQIRAIICKLPSVETLGCVNVVCSDKTGTLTQNKMTVTSCFTGNEPIDFTGKGKDSFFLRSVLEQCRELLECMILCNDASLNEKEERGEATELALLKFARIFGLEKKEMEKNYPRIKEKAFDSQRKMMSTVHRSWKNCVLYSKGAPEILLKKCTRIKKGKKIERMSLTDRKKTEEIIRNLSSDGLRTLAFAMKPDCRDTKEEELIFLGVAGISDPVRPEAKKAVRQFKQAFVTTVMITGDHLETAFAVAKELGIAQTISQCMTGQELDAISLEELKRRQSDLRVFARVSPEHKVKIVKAWKETEHIVAMTGDGVNDAPALKIADIGIAMGQTGTDVARQAADMILSDDNFATIEKAIEEGRSIYENIRKTVLFLLSSNFGEIITMFFAILFGFASPLKASHILWINLITDSLPAFALGVDSNEKEVLMKEPPRQAKESLFANGGLSCTLFYGSLIGLISLIAFLKLSVGILFSQNSAVSFWRLKEILGNQEVLIRSQTYAFTVLGMSQLFHAIGMRDVTTSVFSKKKKQNPVMAAAFFTGLFLQILVTEIPVLTQAFGTLRLSVTEWMSLLVLSAFPLFAHEIFVVLSTRKTGNR